MSLLFNSVRVITGIPLFIIPQLMLGGAIVPFSVHPASPRRRAYPGPPRR